MILADKVTPCRLSLMLAIGFALSAQSCHGTKPVNSADAISQVEPASLEPPKGEVAEYKVQIHVHDGKCVLRYDGPFTGEVETGLRPPCEFSRGHAGGIQHIEQKNRGKGGGYYSVILVIGGPVDPSRSDRFMKTGCGTVTQPISLSPRGIALGGVEGGLTVCPSADLDRPMFGFAAKPV